jgi:hypothetical protein
MKKFICTKGLSFSGKSTWAVEKAKELGNCVIITKDDIRQEMGANLSKGIRVKEGKVIDRRNELIMKALEKGQNIISADTNFSSKVDHIANMKALVYPKYRNEYDFEVKDFTNVSFDEIIERVKKTNRPEGVDYWMRVVKDQKNTYMPPTKLYTNPDYYQQNKRKCVIFDLDGTLAIMNGRSPFDDARCFEDLPNLPMVDVAKMYCDRPDVMVICLSGRDKGRAEDATVNWLLAHGINFDVLYMRKAGDSRKDSIIKRELYEKHIKDQYLVYAVFDDRPQVCRELWAEEGLPLFQFGNPYHEF